MHSSAPDMGSAPMGKRVVDRSVDLHLLWNKPEHHGEQMHRQFVGCPLCTGKESVEGPMAGAPAPWHELDDPGDAVTARTHNPSLCHGGEVFE